MVALTSSTPLGLHSAVVVDDRAEQLVTPAGQHAWREWLRLSNVLGFADQPMSISALSQLTAGTVVTTGATESDTVAAEGLFDPGWRAWSLGSDGTHADRTALAYHQPVARNSRHKAPLTLSNARSGARVLF